MNSVKEYHDEIVTCLSTVARPEIATAIKEDRRSGLEFLGVRAPDLRRVVKTGFSFSAEAPEQVLQIWNDVWFHTPYSDVLSAAVEYYGQTAKKKPDPDQWRVHRTWVQRVDNWAHADGLAGLYSWHLHHLGTPVYDVLKGWNQETDQWLRRMSLVSLIHYTGKNAVFLPLDQVLPLVTNCLSDERYYVQKAVGWVLREMGNAHPADVEKYLEQHLTDLSALALSRATERWDAAERKELRDRRKRSS